MKAGKEYELLIASLYKDLAPNAIIRHDDYIYDDRAKIKRQIDVSIKYMFAGVEHIIIVQAKDYKIKANVSVVDQFQQVIEDTNANKGILICTKGFSEAALNKAKSYGIECLSIHSALNKKWETLVKVEVERHIHNFELDGDVTLNIAHKAGKNVILDHHMYSFDGKNIFNLMDLIYKLILSKYSMREINRKRTIKVNLKGLNIYYIFDEEMLLIDDGFIQIKYLDSSVTRFFIDPVNYIYEYDHIKKKDKLHDLNISIDDLESLVTSDYKNDEFVTGDPNIIVKICKFNDNEGFYMSYEPKVKGKISGQLLINSGIISKMNENGKRLLELEQKIKNNI